MELFDTHCHLDFSAFDNDRENLLQTCAINGVNKIVIPGVSHQNWDDVLQLCSGHSSLYPALGMHPCFTEKHHLSDIDTLERLLSTNQNIVAIGEAGLDFYEKTADRQRQLDILIPQLNLAQRLIKPVLLHVRKAHADMLLILKKHSVPGGIIHAFNGSLEQAQEYIELGFKLGFGGTLTFPGANRIHRLARELPLESIVLETDSPDMAGARHKGQRNSPEYLPEYLQALSDLRQQPILEVAEQVYKNSLRIFNLESNDH